MTIYKVNYKLFGEGQMIIDKNDIEEFDSVKELIHRDKILEQYIFESLDSNEKVDKEFIFNWYGTDEDVLTCCDEAKSEEEFLQKFLTLEDIKKHYIEDDTIYLFRSYQYSNNILLAKFKGFKDIADVKSFCIDNEKNYSEFKGSQYSQYEFNNCYFKRSIEEFDLEDIEAIIDLSENGVDEYIKE